MEQEGPPYERTRAHAQQHPANLKSSSDGNKSRIGLMRDYVTCSNLVCAAFAQTFVALLLFSRGYSFYLDCFGNWLMIKFTFCVIKAKLGGDFC